jgi:hypothetical protein
MESQLIKVEPSKKAVDSLRDVWDMNGVAINSARLSGRRYFQKFLGVFVRRLRDLYLVS